MMKTLINFLIFQIAFYVVIVLSASFITLEWEFNLFDWEPFARVLYLVMNGAISFGVLMASLEY